MDVYGRQFELTLASDLQADGMHLELDELTSGTRVTVASVFYSDVDGSMSFSGYAPDLPLGAIEWLIEEAQKRLPPSSPAV